MHSQAVQFYSSGLKLSGSFYFGDDSSRGKPRPVVIVCSGYQGLNEFYPRLFAEYLTGSGFTCFGFDYRGFANSQGEPGRVTIFDQVEDIRAAIHFTRSRCDVASGSIGLVGWGMGAANVLIAAAREPAVRTVACFNGFYNGRRWLKSVLSAEKWDKLHFDISRDRLNRPHQGFSRKIEPFEYYPLDPATESHVAEHLAPNKSFGIKPTMELPESILEMDAEQDAARLDNRPLFIGHGKDNKLHPLEEAKSLSHTAGAELYLIDGKHNDFMVAGHPEFAKLGIKLSSFLKEELIKPDMQMSEAVSDAVSGTEMSQ